MENQKNVVNIDIKARKRKRKLQKRKERIDRIKDMIFNPNRWSLKKVVMVIGCLYLAYTFIHQQVIISRLKEDRIQSQQDIKKLKSEIKDLTVKIENKTDIVYIERIARDDLNMLRPDEIMYEDEDRPLEDENEKK